MQQQLNQRQQAKEAERRLEWRQRALTILRATRAMMEDQASPLWDSYPAHYGMIRDAVRVAEEPGPFGVIDVEECHAESPEGWLVRDRWRTPREVLADLVSYVGEPGEGWFVNDSREDAWSHGRIVVSCFRGSNEGHFVRISTVSRDGEVRPVLTAKLWSSREAWALAEEVARLLGA